MLTTPRYFNSNQAIFGTLDLEKRLKDGSLETVSLAEAVIMGQAPDGGLFMPTHFPLINAHSIRRMKDLPYYHVFVEVMKDLFGGVLSERTLEKIAQEAYTFEPFIEKISKTNIIARLDEGPTAAFKDYAAQVFFKIIEALTKEEPQGEIDFKQSLRDTGYYGKVITFETAHPGKFPESLERMGIKPELPQCLARLVDIPHEQRRYFEKPYDYNEIKSLLIHLHQQELSRQVK